MFVNLLYLDNFNINVGAIYYPVPDFNNPPVVYPTDDYSYGGNSSGRRSLGTDDNNAASAGTFLE